MFAIQIIILVGLITIGSLIALGTVFDSGVALVTAAYFGWMPLVGALLSHILLVALLAAGRRLPMWGRLCLVNTGLSLIGICIYNSHFVESFLWALVVGAAASLASAAFRWQKFAESPAPAVLTVLLVASMLLMPAGKWADVVLMSLAVVLLWHQVRAALKEALMRRQSHAQQ